MEKITKYETRTIDTNFDPFSCPLVDEFVLLPESIFSKFNEPVTISQEYVDASLTESMKLQEMSVPRSIGTYNEFDVIDIAPKKVKFTVKKMKKLMEKHEKGICNEKYWEAAIFNGLPIDLYFLQFCIKVKIEEEKFGFIFVNQKQQKKTKNATNQKSKKLSTQKLKN